MNLLTDPWMPVRKRDGTREWVAPDRLSDPDLIAFDADRADFNGALAQFAIGLLQTASTVDSPFEWRRMFSAPPDSIVLKDWFLPFKLAFEFDGNGPRFMQDIALRHKARTDEKGEDSGESEDVQQLLIDCAGEGEKTKDNTDHFVKRKDADFGLCDCCCAAALYTLQSSAPGGGRGYLTSIRGGGPLTTLVTVEGQVTHLWHRLWINVIERNTFLEHSGNSEFVAPHFTFPWLKDIRVLQPAGIAAIHFEGEKGRPKPTEEDKPRITPVQVHPFHVYWGTPRRIRLDLSDKSSGLCGVCGRPSHRLIHNYVTKNYGLSYKGAWDHPLSPYYENKEAWLPFHPQPGGLGYRHWLAWVMGKSNERKKQRRAGVVEHFLQQRTRVVPGALRLWAFGYDMDNMKARCWYESTLPLYGLGNCAPDAHKRIESEVANWLAAAELAANSLKGAVKDAWFRDARGDFSAVDAAFWQRTESPFYLQLKQLIDTERDGESSDPVAIRVAWLNRIADTALKLFDDDFAGAGPVERQDPRRIAAAFQQLRRALFGSKMRQALGLPDHQPAKAKGTGKRGTATQGG